MPIWGGVFLLFMLSQNDKNENKEIFKGKRWLLE
jgi:hypothetical protein